MAFDADGNSLEGQYGQGVGFDDSGAYTISNLNATTYRLRVKLEGNHYYRDEWLQSSLTIDDAEGNRRNRGQHGFGSRHESGCDGFSDSSWPSHWSGSHPGTGQTSLRWSPRQRTVGDC